MGKTDYLIVGQGLAGTILATEIKKRGLSFKIIDAGYKVGSTYVAAGVINPLVLKRLTKSWRANEFVSYNEQFYNELNAFYNNSIYFKNKLFKLISSDDEKLFWSNRYHEEDVSFFIEKDLNQIKHANKWSSSFVKGEVKHSSWVNLKMLLSEFRLKHQENIIEEKFDFNKLKTNQNGIEYNELQAKQIVFCDGAKIKQNPYFSYIPMGFNKGELITIESEALQLTEMHKKKVFILPIKDNVYKVGATFEWQWESNSPSNKKKQELITDLNKLIKVPYKIINHEAGVRPSVKDRRPLLGVHPKYNRFYIFNGMGSRGCMMAPLLAKEMIDFVEKGKKLHPESNINRFEKLLS